MKKLNLGCGLEAPAGWINLDGSWSAFVAKSAVLKVLFRLFGQDQIAGWSRNVCFHDLRKHLPFKQGEMDAVYSSHVLEHLYRDEALELLKECERVLKKGGICRIVVPDFRGMAEKYVASEMRSDEFMNLLNMRPLTRPKTGFLKRFYYFLKHDPHFHKCVYDVRALIEILQEAGFQDVKEKFIYDSLIGDIREVEKPDRLGRGLGIAGEGSAV